MKPEIKTGKEIYYERYNLDMDWEEDYNKEYELKKLEIENKEWISLDSLKKIKQKLIEIYTSLDAMEDIDSAKIIIENIIKQLDGMGLK